MTIAAKRSRQPSWILTTVVLTSLGLAAFVAWAWITFGSISTALAFTAGQRLVLDPSIVAFGQVDVGSEATVEVGLINLTGHPVRLLGAQSSCTCAVASGLPATVPPSGRHPIRVTVRGGTRQGDIAEAVSIFTDCKDEPRLALRVVGRITASNPSTSTSIQSVVVPDAPSRARTSGDGETNGADS